MVIECLNGNRLKFFCEKYKFCVDLREGKVKTRNRKEIKREKRRGRERKKEKNRE